jgi:peptidylprolyl isomerase
MTQAKAGDTVRVHYSGSLDDGTVFDSSKGGEPIEFTLGQGAVIEGFERAVAGMRVGETRTVTLPPEEAYGAVHQELVIRVERSRMPPDVAPQPGMVLEVRLENGNTARVTVTDMDEQSVTLDGNHPLAGESLTFEIELVQFV